MNIACLCGLTLDPRPGMSTTCKTCLASYWSDDSPWGTVVAVPEVEGYDTAICLSLSTFNVLEATLEWKGEVIRIGNQWVVTEDE